MDNSAGFFVFLQLILRKGLISIKIRTRKEGAVIMETKRWNLNGIEDVSLINESINEAADLLKSGSTVAFPTETVYGLGADATNEEAVANIFKAKGRPQDNPLIAHVATIDQLKELVTDLPAYAEKLIEAYTPGPITFVLPSNGTCATNVTAGLSSIAVRIPDHPLAHALLTSVNLPIAAPSANLSGKPSPTTADHVWIDLSGKIAGILDGGATGIGMESTVVNCLNAEGPVILRPGGITEEQIEKVTGKLLNQDPAINLSEKPQSPGMKYKHYAPEMPLWIIEGTADEIQDIIDEERQKGRRVGMIARDNLATQLNADQMIFLGKDLSDVAANLYHALREFKEDQIDLIISESFPNTGIGQAVMNRLSKAASRK